MSNTPRPKLNKQASKAEKDRQAALDESMDVRIDGTVYSIVLADITGLVEMRIRRETGFSVMELITKMQGDSMGMDVLGCFMYACEVAAGRDANLEAILASVSWASEVDVVESAEAEPVPQP